MTEGTRFPGPQDFTGSYYARTSDAQEGAQSTYNGSIAVTLLDRAIVEKVLPGDFRLAARIDGADKHPVIHLLGHQCNLKTLHNGIPQPVPDDDYQEMILLVPFVMRGASMKWHSFVVRMYLNDFGAIGIGNTVYAYAKELARLPESGSPNDLRTRILLPLLGLFFQGTVTLTSSWRGSDEARMTSRRWRDIQTIFEMPLVGADVVGGKIIRIVCSYWEWDYTNAEVVAAISQHQFVQPFRDGMDGWVQLGPLSSACDGAVAIRGLRWRLALPPPHCQF